jgi:hypothetical protein
MGSEMIMIPDRLDSSFRRIGRGSLGVIVGSKIEETYLRPGLEVVEEDVHTLAIYSIVLYDDATASYDLAGVTVLVNFAETGPSAEELCVSDLDEIDLMVRAECLNELDILCLGVGLDEDTNVGLSLIQGLCALSETSSQAVVLKANLQNLHG